MYYQQNFDYQLNYARQSEKRNLSAIGKACGGAVVGFAVLGTIIGLLLLKIHSFYVLYENNTVFSTAFNALLAILTLFFPFYFAYIQLKKKNLIGELPLCEPYDKNDFALLIPIAIMICIIGSIFTGVFSTAVDSLFGIEFTQPEDTNDYTTVSGIIITEVATALVPAFVEEFAIRGVVLQALRRYGDGFAIVMSSFVFALMHGNMIQIPFAFIAGMALGYVAIKTGSLWTGIVVHFINNSLAVISLVIIDNFSENVSNIFNTALYIFVFVLGGICLWIYTKKNRGILNCLYPDRAWVHLSTSEKIGSFIINLPMVLSIIILVGETAIYIKT